MIEYLVGSVLGGALALAAYVWGYHRGDLHADDGPDQEIEILTRMYKAECAHVVELQDRLDAALNLNNEHQRNV